MDRYSRQRLFSKIGDSGQAALGSARVTLIGCGALGTHIAQHLSRAGVGYLRICDRDFVELDNLQRQVLFEESDAEQRIPKAIAAARKIAQINSDVEVEPHVTDVTPQNVLSLIKQADVVLDGTDNFVTRFLLNDACVSTQTPWVYGGCVASHGMVLAVLPGETPCFSCVIPDLPPPGASATCDTAGVVGPGVAMVAALQAAEAMKILVGDRDALAQGLITLDVWTHQYRVLKVPRDPQCLACGQGDFKYLRAAGTAETTTILCGRNAVQVTPARSGKLDLAALGERLSQLGTVRSNEFVLRFQRDQLDATLFPDGRAVVKGTDDPAQARAFYAKYIGS